jgi:Ca2+-binding EF-hand superfamily protein
MSMVRKLIISVGMSLVVGSVSTAAIAVSKRTNAAAQADIRQLLRLMDKDLNGKVSKDEFLRYMSQTFDRLDVNKSGQLERNELPSAEFPFGRLTGAAAATDVRKLVRMMDTDMNGTVSRDEFMQFMSQTFDRLDVNKSGQLERDEMRRMADPNWLLCHDLRMC